MTMTGALGLDRQFQFAAEDADDAASESENGGHEQDTHNKSPAFSIVADNIPQKDNANRAQYGTEKSAHPSCNRHDHHLS